MAPFNMPLATLEDLYAELEDTNRAIYRMNDGLIINRDRWQERRTNLLAWREKLEEQIAERETAAQ